MSRPSELQPRLRPARSRAAQAAVLGGLLLSCMLAGAPAALAAEAAPVSAVPPPAGSGIAPAAPGRVRLTLVHVGGSPPFALLGARIVIRGTVAPFVAAQTVRVSFYREGRKVGVQTVAVAPGATPTAAGQFRVGFVSHLAGLVEARAAHYATPQQVAFSARAPGVHFVNPGVGPGSQGPSVGLLQSELSSLHYAVPLSGIFEEGTAQALIAYRKMLGMERVGVAGPAVFRLLGEGAGAYRVRFPQDGRHVEANLDKQVLVEIEPGGKVHDIYTMSSGKPSTPTVIGHFQVYLKTPGVNSEDMVDSNYFIRGYAIHGYPEVPTYAASHGCLRVPIPDAPGIFAWVRTGTPVDVYTEDGGGSARVRSDAGP